MGNISGTTQISYKTKTDIPINYIFYDLKGKSRYPDEPNNETEINEMFEKCLNEIQVHKEQLQTLKDFNSKYRYRFVVMHKRKIAQHYQKLVGTSHSTATEEEENKTEKKKQVLEQKMKQIEENKSSLKILLMKLDKYIVEKRTQFEFLEIDGIQRVLTILQKQIKGNKEGLKTNFGNQIDLLRFLKSYSSHFPKEFFTSIEKNEKYAEIILSAYHPIHVGVTSYVLSLLEDYIWRCEENKNLFYFLKSYAKQEKYTYYLQPFAETLDTTDNILMVYYHLKFINEILVATVNEKQKESLKDEMMNVKYGVIVENIKAKLQGSFYKLQYCTFTHVHQQIFRFATKGRSNFSSSIIGTELNIPSRNTLNIKDLQNHIMMNLHDFTGEAQEYESDDQEEEIMTVYLNESAKKKFEKYILDVLYQIGNYLKLQIYSNPQFIDENYNTEERQEMMIEKNMVLENKMQDMKVNEYIKHIRTHCIKNNCTNLLFSCLKNLQYFEKAQWKKLDSFVLEELGIQAKKNTDEESLRKVIKEKDELNKKLTKQITDLKNQIANLKENLQKKQNTANNFRQTLTSLQKKQEKSSNSLLPPPPPPPSTQKKLNQSLLPPPPPNIKTQTLSMPSPPPPPPIGQNIGSANLPQIPTLTIEQPTGKIKQKKQPNVALKNCNYIVLSYDKIQNSIWSQINDDNVKLDLNELQTLFAKTVVEKQIKKPSTIEIQQVQKKQVVKLLGAERWRNVQIILTKVKIPKGQMKRALFQCSGRYCDPLVLQSINKILPNQDEQQSIKLFAGNPEQLGMPEQFFRQLMEVPEFNNRIKSMIFISHKEEFYFEVEDKLEKLTTAFQSLKSNYRFHHVLEVSLAVGNYLNGTSFKGGAWGFKLDSLERLEEVQSTDNKMNAAFFVIKQAWKNFSYPLFDKEQLQLYQLVEKISVSQVKGEIAQLRVVLKAMRKAMDSKISEVKEFDFIGAFCEEAMMELELKLEDFTDKLAALQEKFKECAMYYCEDPIKVTSEEIGRKIFSCILFLSNTEKTLKVVEGRWKKQKQRKAIKHQLKYSLEEEEKKETKKVEKKEEKREEKKAQKKEEKSIQKQEQQKNNPKMSKAMSREERMKEFEKKAMQDLMKKREAFRKAKVEKNAQNEESKEPI